MQDFTLYRLSMYHYQNLRQQAKAARLAKVTLQAASRTTWSSQVHAWILAIVKSSESRFGGIEHP